VQFKNKLFAQMLFVDQATGAPQVFEFSTDKSIQRSSNNLLVAPVVKAFAQDLDRNGKPDQWNITLQVRAPDAGLYLQSASVIMAFDYTTDYSVHMQMEGLVIAQVTVPSPNSVKVPVKSIKTQGNLNLVQKNAISSGLGIGANVIKRLEYNDNFISQLESVTIDELILDYNRRTETTRYDFKKSVQYGAQPDASQPTSNFVTIEMVVRVPQTQEVIYVPPFWSVLKFAWIQYFCALVFWYYLLYEWFFGSLIKAHVFET
jgi:hypothetical protein